MNRYSGLWAQAGAALTTAGVLAASPAAAQGINVTVNGEVVPFTGQPPVERFGSVLVPLRGVFERLGASVAYDGATKSILAVKGATSISLNIGGSQAQVNGQTRALSQPAQAINGTTLVPLRFVSEALGAEVRWSGATRTVVINTNGAPVGAVASNSQPGQPGQPVAGNAAPAPGAPEVMSLSHSAPGKALRAGDVLSVTLNGSPGGAASFAIPGIAAAQNVAMRETSPGTYVGTVTLPAGVNAKGATVLASLKRGGVSSPLIQAPQPVTVDTVGPVVASLSPAPNVAVPPGKPLVYGTLSDAGTGVDTAATRLLVDGKDVTGQATITGAFFSYRPDADLPLGKNTVTVLAHDAAGNETRENWSFTVSQAEALVNAVSFSPDTKTLEPGDVLTVRAEGQPGGKARFNVGGAVVNQPMREESPGVYVGTYTVRKGDSLAQAPVSVAFTSSTGRSVTQAAAQPVTIAAGAPEKPVITSPSEGAATGESVVIRGKAKPNATVRYSLKYQGVLVVLPAGGTVADGEVKANANGDWSTPEIRLNSPLAISKLTYSVEVATVGASGELSDTASLSFKR